MSSFGRARGESSSLRAAQGAVIDDGRAAPGVCQ